MVTNHLQAPYGVFVNQKRIILQRPYGSQPGTRIIVHGRYFMSQTATNRETTTLKNNTINIERGNSKSNYSIYIHSFFVSCLVTVDINKNYSFRFRNCEWYKCLNVMCTPHRYTCLYITHTPPTPHRYTCLYITHTPPTPNRYTCLYITHTPPTPHHNTCL